MKNLIISLLILFQIGYAFSTTHHIPINGEDQGPDIPLIGSSLFDKIFSKTDHNNITNYDLPHPIGKLMERMSPGNGINIVHSMLPFSRSLQRPSNDSYHPLLNPRLVFTSKQSNTWLERGKIFIGFVKATNQLEVISYNDEAGRFEYQLVKDYGKKPKVFYVNRGKCLSCHQGQAPIFSVPGWQDTNTGVLGGLIAAKLGMPTTNNPQSRQELGKKLFGKIPSLDAVGNFDAIVRESNEIALDERIWNIGCGKNKECRLGLLLSTLAPNSKSAKKYLEKAKIEILNSNLPTQNMYSSFLPSTDIGALKVMKKYSNSGPGSAYENTANNDQAIAEIVTNIYKLKGSENPANRRQRNFSKNRLVPKSLSGFTFNDRRIIDSEVSNIELIILDLFQSGSKIFEQKAINKPLIMYTILERVNSSKATIYSSLINKKTPKKKLFDGKTIPVFKEPTLNIFARYCHQCHATGLPFPPQFLTGSESEVNEKIKNMASKIHFKLTNGLMPPNKTERDLLKSSGDLDEILLYLDNFLNL